MQSIKKGFSNTNHISFSNKSDKISGSPIRKCHTQEIFKRSNSLFSEKTTHSNFDKNLDLNNPTELMHYCELVECQIKNTTLLIEQAACLGNKMPFLTFTELIEFRSAIIEGCLFNLTDFPVSSLTTFNEYDSAKFDDWQFCVYHLKNHYYISQYTIEGLKQARIFQPPRDLKLLVNLNQAYIITFTDLQTIELCFLAIKSPYNYKLSEVIAKLRDKLSTLNDDLYSLQCYQNLEEESRVAQMTATSWCCCII